MWMINSDLLSVAAKIEAAYHESKKQRTAALEHLVGRPSNVARGGLWRSFPAPCPVSIPQQKNARVIIQP